LYAVRMHDYGGLEQLFYERAEDPTIAEPHEVIVKLSAASINHIDIWNRMGATGTPLRMPHILGADGAGTVVEIGPQVANVRAGDAVCLYPPTGCGTCEFCLTDRDYMCIHLHVLGERLEGTYAEYVKITAANCFPIPNGYSFEQAAALPLVFITVWRMVITNAELKPGESILIIGIGGGVASASLQIAKRIGTRVIVTSGSDEKLRWARELGADHGINHKREDIVAVVKELTQGRGVDLVVDCVGGEVWQKSLASLSRGGRLVTCGATAGGQPKDDIAAIATKQLKIYGSTLGSREEFRQVLSFLSSTRIAPIIDSVFPLKDAAAAQQRVESAQQFGKVVLRIPQ
jgi:NADPH:quinone reductase-like Zn-dependent oxidoreductase